MRQLVGFKVFVLAIVFVVCPVLVFAAAEKSDEKKKDSSPPISISADQMEANDQQSLIIFTGNVVTRQEDMILNCDRMRVYYATEETASSASGSEKESSTDSTAGNVLGGRESQIKRIEAEGNVKITKGDRVAQAQKAVYYAKSSPRTIILTGDPRVWQDKDFLTGAKITYFLDENRSLVEGGPKKRVNAIFYQESDEKKDGKE